MKVDLSDGIGDELRALGRTFKFTDGNSREEKMALWVAMGLFAIGAVGVLFGFVDLSDPGVASLWTLLVGVMSFLWGDARRKERVLMAREPKRE